MKKFALYTALGMSVLGGTFAHAAQTSTTITATIVEALALGSSTIQFGKFAVGNLGGTIEASGGTTKVTSGDLVVITGGGPAEVAVTGASGTAYTLIIPATTTLASAGNSDLTVNLFDEASGNAGTINRTLDNTGADFVNVGGRINVPGNQGGGVYNGTFTITANYQ
ncbi:MAG: hypothetical protein K0R63_723 [Rickettsiales bacterium]|nr:hypothetical protein [Rickettsiales bacterium]